MTDLLLNPTLTLEGGDGGCCLPMPALLLCAMQAAYVQSAGWAALHLLWKEGGWRPSTFDADLTTLPSLVTEEGHAFCRDCASPTLHCLHSSYYIPLHCLTLESACHLVPHHFYLSLEEACLLEEEALTQALLPSLACLWRLETTLQVEEGPLLHSYWEALPSPA
jgi:hypothetical protein